MGFVGAALGRWRAALAGWRGLAVLGLVALALAAAAQGGSRVALSAMQVAAPLWEAFAAPVRWARSAVGEVGDYAAAVAERDRLAQENQALRAWRALALALDEKRRVYEGLLAVAPEPAATQITARVVAESGGPFVNALVAMAGSGDGVRAGQAVLGEGGLLGRVAMAGPAASRVLLLIDINARVPALAEGRGVFGALVGDNTARPRLESLHGREGALETLTEGDRIMTSGHGGVLPPGLPIGRLVADGEGGWRVALFAEPRAASHVRVLRYDLARTLDAEG